MASTLFVRVPAVDWPLVKRGQKREFRGSMGKSSRILHTPMPSPCVAYSVVRGSHDARLMLLEDVRQEMLGEISEESLAAEGFNDLAEFRRYWMARERNRKFAPTRHVFVYRLRPWEPGLAGPMGRILLRRLYGAFMEEDDAASA